MATYATLQVKGVEGDMTFAELREFVAECLRKDVPDGTRFQVDMSWTSKLKGLTTIPPD